MMGEYVSRTAALQAVGDIHPLDYNGQGIVERIKAIPAADVVEVRHGRWITKYVDGSWRGDTCSVCNKDTHYVRFAPEYDYCPNCGAKMDGGQE